MLQPYNLLLIASQLSVLTYYIGVLLYALPIPDYKVKRWAPLMIRDGIWTAILVVSFTLLLNVSDLIASFSGYTLSSIAKLSDNIIATIFSYNFIIRVIAALVSLAPGATSSLIYAAALPLFLTQYTVLWAALTMLLLTLIIAEGKSLLAALGIALMAIPFRIGRSAGASLLAFALVANSMLPYFPAWLNTLAGVTGASFTKLFYSNETYYTVWGLIRDAYGGYASYSAIIFDKTNSNEKFIFKVNSDGTYIVALPYYLEEGTYHAYLDYMGLMITLQPSTVKIPGDLRRSYRYVGVDYRLDLYASSSIVFLRPLGVLVKPRNCLVGYVGYGSESNIITLLCQHNWTTITIRVPENCKLSVVISGSRVYAKRVTLAPWRGVMVRVISLALMLNGSREVALNVKEECMGAIPKPLVKEGVTKPAGSASAITQIFIIILLYPFAAFSFVTLLSMVVLGLARSLGAVHPRVVFDI
jgi:hypothetical protein